MSHHLYAITSTITFYCSSEVTCILIMNVLRATFHIYNMIHHSTITFTVMCESHVWCLLQSTHSRDKLDIFPAGVIGHKESRFHWVDTVISTRTIHHVIPCCCRLLRPRYIWNRDSTCTYIDRKEGKKKASIVRRFQKFLQFTATMVDIYFIFVSLLIFGFAVCVKWMHFRCKCARTGGIVRNL